MNFEFRRRLASRLFVLLLAATVVPVALTAVVQHRFVRGLLDGSMQEALGARVDAAAGRVEDLHARYQATVRRLALLPELLPQEPARLAPLLRRFLDSDLDLQRILILDVEGVVRTASEPELAGMNLGSRAWFRTARRGDAPAPAAEDRDIVYAAPVKSPSGVTIGVVAIVVRVEAFTAALRAGGTGAHEAALFDPVGSLVAGAASVPEPSSAAFEHLRAAGHAAARPLPSVHWTLAVLGPRSAADEARRSLVMGTVLGVGAVALLALLAHLLVVRRALMPIRKLDAAAAAIAAGDFGARASIGGKDELAQLGQRFDDMAQALAVAYHDQEERVRERTAALEGLNVELRRRNEQLADRSDELARHRYREQAKGRALAALTAEADLGGMLGAAMGELAAPIGAAVMVCYQLEGDQLVPVASYAASEAARTRRLRLDGVAAHALQRGRIELVEEVPADLELRFDCLLAAGRPRSLAFIPLTVGRRQTGLILVGGLAPLTLQRIEPLCDIAAPIALTIARRTLVDETERIARELSRKNAELRQQAEELAAQGEELKAHQSELELKNREVEKADRLKSEFLANMSHELRTPLNAVIGFSELLLEEKGELKPAHVQYAEDIHVSGRHLLTLINRVLDLAKIEAGRMVLSLEPVLPAEAIASATTLIRPQAQRKRISVEIEAGTTRAVRADAGKLQQILINLLANAVKFSPENSAVRVGAFEQDGVVRFQVSDRGPGIEVALQEQLFKPFFQAENPLVKKHEGTGLGLAISKRLVEQQGGAIGFESTPGQGSTFWFTVPAAPADTPAPTRTEDRAPPPVEGAPRVLVADDHDLNRDLVRTLLERRGCRVTLARDGMEALERARAETPDLVLLDLAMPRKDGLAVAAELRRDPRTAQIPLIAFTALAIRADDPRVADFDDLVAKPVDRRVLEAAVARMLTPLEAA